MLVDQSVIQLIVLVLLAVCLYFGHRVCIAVMSNIDKLGSDKEGKERISTRAIANFWIGFAAVLIVASGIFELIGKELFVALLVADLLGLGLKLTTEFLNHGNK